MGWDFLLFSNKQKNLLNETQMDFFSYDISIIVLQNLVRFIN